MPQGDNGIGKLAPSRQLKHKKWIFNIQFTERKSVYVWHKRYKSGEREYNIAYLLFERGSKSKVKVSGYRPRLLWLRLHALTTWLLEMQSYIQAWKSV